jgi:hypothetical protein
MRARDILIEAVVKTPITFTYTGKDGRYMGDVVYINIDSKDLRDILMFCMEADGLHSAGMITELSSKYITRYNAAVAKRKKELGVA